MRLIKLIEEMIITFLNETTLNLKKQAIENSENRIAKLEYKLENEKEYYRKLLKETFKWCGEVKKRKV